MTVHQLDPKVQVILEQKLESMKEDILRLAFSHLRGNGKTAVGFNSGITDAAAFHKQDVVLVRAGTLSAAFNGTAEHVGAAILACEGTPRTKKQLVKMIVPKLIRVEEWLRTAMEREAGSGNPRYEGSLPLPRGNVELLCTRLKYMESVAARASHPQETVGARLIKDARIALRKPGMTDEILQAIERLAVARDVMES